ncbi:MAG: hypothetical protein KJ955_03065 [Nanoarchaeota archaeon]|nr:hypothetical protein [Nanoarchaeota archaeon]
MAWYKPWTWGEKSNPDTTVLYCDNPQCRRPINGGEFAFDAQNGRLYHPTGCAMLGSAWDAFSTGKVSCMNVEHINREQAIKVEKERRSELEKKVG